MAKKKGVDLPDWAKSMWEDMGSPELEGLDSVFNGDLLERRAEGGGLRLRGLAAELVKQGRAP